MMNTKAAVQLLKNNNEIFLINKIKLAILIHPLQHELWTSLSLTWWKFKEYYKNNMWWHRNKLRIMGKNCEAIIATVGKTKSMIGSGLMLSH